VLAGTSIRSEGATRIAGNAGVSPGHQVSGLPASAVRVGAIVDERTARDAQRDAAAAAAQLALPPCDATLAALTGTLAPGVYCFETDDVELTGTLYLDAAGDRDALWIFRVSGKLATASDSSIRILGGGSAGGVFWSADEAVLGARTTFAGNVFARTRIAFGNGASLSGRALARTGAVTLDGNGISLCCAPIALSPSRLPDGAVSEEYAAPRLTPSGGLPPYTFAAASLPPGLSVSADGLLTGVPASPGTFAFPVTATDAQGCPGTAIYRIAITGAIDGPPGTAIPTLSGWALLVLSILVAAAGLTILGGRHG
jgi:hypothetical protein